ncbi:molybdate metabolism regulator [Leptospira yasudae]|uniref:Molybdate metabolism regulator n=1 Tax=Leptospira yasudae TaxID=2202201 RepID=A0ABX9M5Y2_9LEPT|nr:molybdate metabolism regulator [Leptospira yasudae]RHX80782.1 molybdate metabolism regulator [Leptospira yasudae]RHX94395.1 molybdate metabolism regulator [Leptospira yasudae]
MNLFTEKLKELLNDANQNSVSRPYSERLQRIDWDTHADTIAKSLRDAYQIAIDSEEKVSGCLLYMSGETANGFRLSEISFAEEEDDPGYQSGPVHDEAHFNIEEPGKILHEASKKYFDEDKKAYHLIWDAAMTLFAHTVAVAAEKSKETEEFKTLNKTKKFKVAVAFHDSWGCDIEEGEGLVWESNS